MAKRYMGEKDPALDALYEQLDATGRETRADRRTRRQIERQIRKIRAGRLGGIRGLFRGLVDDVGQGLLRQHISQPQIDQFADETVAGKDVFPTPAQDVLGRNFGFRVPPTAAEVAPEIEEIEVTAEKRPEIVAEIVEDQWVPWKSLMRVSKKRELPVGTFSKKNQRYNPETRQWEIRVLPELMNEAGYAHGGKLSGQADRLARAGRGDDTMLMHVTPDEVAGLASLAPGMMTINPETGLPEAGWFKNLLGTAAPFLMAMIPGVGPMAAGAMSGGLRTLLQGGDIKDLVANIGIGALGAKMFGGASEAGADVLAGEAATGAMATPEAFGQAMQGVGPEGLTDIATQAGITPNQLSFLSAPATADLSAITMPTGTITSAIQSGVDPSIAFSQAGVSPESLGVFKEGLSGVARESMPDTLSQNIKNIGAGGLSGLKSAIFKPEGITYITTEALKAQNEGQQAYQDFLLAKEAAERQRERDIAAYYSENLPYLAREGGSIYKNRYINGNWS